MEYLAAIIWSAPRLTQFVSGAAVVTMAMTANDIPGFFYVLGSMLCGAILTLGVVAQQSQVS